MPSVSELFQLIIDASPDVKAALIGNIGLVVATFVTMLLTALFATRQFAHERREKAKDRALEVKKEVLLNAIRGAMQVSASFGMFGNMAKSADEIVATYLGGVEKLSVAGAVADVETVKAIRNLLAEAAPRLPKFIAVRAPLDSAAQDVAFFVESVNKLLRENDEVLKMQAETLVAGDQQRFNSLQGVFDARQEQINKAAGKRDEARRVITGGQPELIRMGWAAQQDLQGLVKTIVARVRVDVGVDSGTADFLEAATFDDSKMKASMDELLKELHKGMEAH